MEEIKFTLNLRETLKKGRIEALEILVKSAMLNSNELMRKAAVRSIESKYKGITRGFMGDNQLFVVIENDLSRKVAYVCDLPRGYDYQEIYNFTVE